MFNPRATVRHVPLGTTAVLVIDDALKEPQRLRDWAIAHPQAFETAPGNAFPGVQAWLDDGVAALLGEFVSGHARALGVRRLKQARACLGMACLAPAELQPFQMLPHVDPLGQPGLATLASVLYLFDDPSLGGTAFYRPRTDPERLAGLLRDAGRLDAASFAAGHGVARAYPADGDAWFERGLSIPARWNRMLIYLGSVFHSGTIPNPARLSRDPARGRLTLNGFYLGRRALAV